MAPGCFSRASDGRMTSRGIGCRGCGSAADASPRWADRTSAVASAVTNTGQTQMRRLSPLRTAAALDDRMERLLGHVRFAANAGGPPRTTRRGMILLRCPLRRDGHGRAEPAQRAVAEGDVATVRAGDVARDRQ